MRRGVEPSMNMKRAGTAGVAGGALAAWLATAATPGVRQIVTPVVEPASPIEPRGVDLAAEIRRLHDRLHPDATPNQPGRNLFMFASRRPRPDSAVVAPQAPAPAPSVASVVGPPELKLIGVAEDQGSDGPVRTGILSGPGQLFLVREGQNVTARYRVVRVSPEVVELADVGDGSTLRLALAQ